MKKTIATLAFALLGVGLLAGCDPTTDVNVVAKEDIYAFQAVTAVSMLTDGEVELVNSPLPTIKYLDDSEDTSEVVDEVEDEGEVEVAFDITKYIGIMEQLLSDDEAPIIVNSLESDNELYTYKLEVTTNYLTGDSVTYVLYYNELTEEEIEVIETSEIEDSEETSLETSEEVSTPLAAIKARRGGRGNDEENDWRNNPGSGTFMDTDEIDQRGRMGDMADHDEFLAEGGLQTLTQTRDEYQNHHGHGVGEFNEDAELINLEGIIIIDDVEYSLVGTRGDNATSFFVSLNETNWIRMVQVVNDNMTRYMMNSSIDGVLSRIAFKAQIEDDKTKVSLFLLEDGVVTSYSFRTMVRNDQEVLMIRVIEDETVTHVIAYPSVDETTGEVTYTYEFFESGHGYGFHGHHHN